MTCLAILLTAAALHVGYRAGRLAEQGKDACGIAAGVLSGLYGDIRKAGASCRGYFRRIRDQIKK